MILKIIFLEMSLGLSHNVRETYSVQSLEQLM